MLLAAVNTANGEGILCTILLFATIIAFILGLVQLLGFDQGKLGGVFGGRFSTLIVFVVLLVAYALFC